MKKKKRKAPQKHRNSRKKKKRLNKKKKRGVLFELLFAVLGTLLLFFFFFTLAFYWPKVTGYSMTPTVNDQERLLVYKWGKIRRFTLVYFNEPNGQDRLIGRVIGLPGETVAYRGGELLVDGEIIPERFLSQEFSDVPVTEDFTLKVFMNVNDIPDDSYFILGDNRMYATDSRYFGFVHKKQIKGVVKARVFPINDLRQF